MEFKLDQNIWVTSDSHYGHKNCAGPTISAWKSGYRNFTSVSEMNETLVNHLNEKVDQDDILFHLGDFAWGNPYNIQQFRERIICKNIILILGNHDKEIRKRQNLRSLFTEVYDYGYETYIHKIRFVFNHCAMRVWNGSHRGSIHLFGHSHGSLPDFGRSMDVGVDTNDCYPYNINDIIKKFETVPVNILDHHELD